MSSVIFHTVVFPDVPSGNQTLTLEKKLSTQPASSYVQLYNNISAAPTGDNNILNSPLPAATGLTSGLLYDFRWSNNCSSPTQYFTIQVTAP